MRTAKPVDCAHPKNTSAAHDASTPPTTYRRRRPEGLPLRSDSAPATGGTISATVAPAPTTHPVHNSGCCGTKNLTACGTTVGAMVCDCAFHVSHSDDIAARRKADKRMVLMLHDPIARMRASS